MGLLATEFLSAVKLRCFWPAAEAPLSDLEILSIGDQECAGKFYALVQDIGGDYYLASADIPLVTGTSKYRLPGEAFGAFKDLALVGSNGEECSLPLMGAEEISHTSRSQRAYGAWPVAGVGQAPYMFYLDGDKAGLHPAVTDADGDSLRVRYYQGPAKLTHGSDGLPEWLQVVAVDLEADPLVFGTNEDTDDLYDAGDTIDVVGSGNASAAVARSLVLADEGSAFGVTTWTVDRSLIDTGIAVGDYLIATGYTPVVQLPSFLHSAYIRWCAAACLQANSDGRAGGEFAAAQNLIDAALRSISKPRVKAEPKYTIARNSPYRIGRRF